MRGGGFLPGPVADVRDPAAVLPAALPLPGRGQRARAVHRGRPEAGLRGELDRGQVQAEEHGALPRFRGALPAEVRRRRQESGASSHSQPDRGGAGGGGALVRLRGRVLRLQRISGVQINTVPKAARNLSRKLSRTL